MSDALADLGLNLDNTNAETAPVADTAVAVANAREEVEIGELEFGFADFVPAQKRGGASGSKYEFDKLDAPVAKEDGTGWKYATFTAKLQEGVDADKLKRSVQSATTAANRAAKDSGAPNRYVTRQHIVAGEFAGVIVFRVDGTIATEDKAE